MRIIFFTLFIFLFSELSLAHNAQTTLNLFSPNSMQRSYSRVEGAHVLNKSELALSLFFDHGLNTLAIYNNPAVKNDDTMTFGHLGFYYGLTSKLEIGGRFPFLINQQIGSDQDGYSIRLYESGFTDSIGYAKYNFFANENHGFSILGQVAKGFSKNVFYEGEGSGISLMGSAIYERFWGPWALALNLGYIVRNPGDPGGAYVYFEPIKSTVIASAGLSRQWAEKNSLSLELIHTQNTFDLDQSNREKQALEASLSYRRFIGSLTLALGVGGGLMDGVSEPDVRGFAGLHYRHRLFESKTHKYSAKVVGEEEEATAATDDGSSDTGNEGGAVAAPVGLAEDVEGKEEDERSEEMAVAGAAAAGTTPEPSIADEDAAAEEEGAAAAMAAAAGVPVEPEENIYTDKVYQEFVQIDEKVEPKQVLEEFTKESQRSDEIYQKIVIEHVEFEFDSYKLDEPSIKILDGVIEYLQNTEYQHLKVLGHTDFYGSTLYNENLSLKRALSVLKYLRSKGIDVKQMSFDGYGKRRPLNTGISEEKRKKNRRVEIIIRKK